MRDRPVGDALKRPRAGVVAPQVRDGPPEHGMANVAGDVGHRRQHEGVLDQIGPRYLQMPVAAQHEIVVQQKIDIERATGKTWHVASTAMAVLQPVQPRIQTVRIQIRPQTHGHV